MNGFTAICIRELTLGVSADLPGSELLEALVDVNRLYLPALPPNVQIRVADTARLLKTKVGDA